MPRPKLVLAIKYLTAPQVAKRLNLSRMGLYRRIELGIFPRPTYIDNTGVQRVHYFDENWVKIAQAILANAPQREQRTNE